MAPIHEHMARAISLARRGLYTTDPNPRVGCVLVRDGRVVGEGWHRLAGEPHAEIHALAGAGAQAHGATAYVTLEPCCHRGRTGACTRALIDAGVSRVVVAMLDPNPAVGGGGLRELRAAGVTTETGLLEPQAAGLNRGFVKRMTEGRPWVRGKLAMSLDGRTAMASGESRWITGPEARHDVHRLRARSSAMLTGIGTVLADDPALTARLEQFGESTDVRPPLKVVLDSELATPPAAAVLRPPGSTLVICAHRDEGRAQLLETAGAEVLAIPDTGRQVDAAAVLALLAGREVNEVMVECGATLAGHLLEAGLLDELIIYVAPVLMGDAARGLLHLPAIREMADRIELEVSDVRPVGVDWRVTAALKSRGGDV